jgi:putative glutamine amidotransferase
MQDDRPIIGVTGPDEGGAAAWMFTRYAVWRAGGHAVRITPQRPRQIDGLDALVIGGGADVDPVLYGQERIPVPESRPADETRVEYLLDHVLFPLIWGVRKVSGQSSYSGLDQARDELERGLIDAAVGRGLPVLGICRGSQLLNVYFGGTLHQELSGFYVEDPAVRSILPRKRIIVEEGTRLERLLGRRPRKVNALHRQAVDRLGRGMRVAAQDRNGIVYAVEHESLPFVLGVQWHPEYLPQLPEQRAIFRMLVKQAKQIMPATSAERRQIVERLAA